MGRRRRRKNKQFNFRVNPKLIWIAGFSILTIIVTCGIGYAVYTASIFKIKENDIVSNMDLGRSIKEKIKGNSLFSLDIESISSRLIKENPEYEDVYVLRRFPSTVVIEAKRRTPFAQIKGKKFYPVDKKAVILSDGANISLDGLIPIEISEHNRLFRKGYNIKDKRLEAAFKLIECLEESRLTNKFRVKLVNAVKLQAIHFIIASSTRKSGGSFNEDIKVIVGNEDFTQRIKVLKNLVNQELKNKLSLVEYIDLRYKKVYVGFRR